MIPDGSHTVDLGVRHEITVEYLQGSCHLVHVAGAAQTDMDRRVGQDKTVAVRAGGRCFAGGHLFRI